MRCGLWGQPACVFLSFRVPRFLPPRGTPRPLRSTVRGHPRLWTEDTLHTHAGPSKPRGGSRTYLSPLSWKHTSPSPGFPGTRGPRPTKKCGVMLVSRLRKLPKITNCPLVWRSSPSQNCEYLSGSVFFRVACFDAQPRSNCRRSAAPPPAVLDDAPVEVEVHAAAAGQQSTPPPPPATASSSCASAAAGSPACPCSFTSPAAAPSRWLGRQRRRASQAAPTASTPQKARRITPPSTPPSRLIMAPKGPGPSTPG